MIKIPEDILTADELVEATGRKAKELDIEITGLSVDRSSLVLSIDTKLNFVMPRNLESIMKDRIRARLGSVNKIRVNYMYSGIKIPPQNSETSSDSSQEAITAAEATVIPAETAEATGAKPRKSRLTRTEEASLSFSARTSPMFL